MLPTLNTRINMAVSSKITVKSVVRDLLMHFISSFIISFFIYVYCGSLAYILFFIAGSIFIDLDHLADYILHFGLRFDLKKFMVSQYLESGRVYIVLHSWELFA